MEPEGGALTQQHLVIRGPEKQPGHNTSLNAWPGDEAADHAGDVLAGVGALRILTRTVGVPAGLFAHPAVLQQA